MPQILTLKTFSAAAIGMAVALFAQPALADTINYSGTIATQTITSSGVYQITAYGAQGGSVPGSSGGHGAEASGEFYLTTGDVLQILVAGQGGSGNYSGGGGGGSFVALGNTVAGSTLLVAAGGGGGAGPCCRGYDGTSSTAGVSPAGYVDPGSGGSNGGGGSAGEFVNGGLEQAGGGGGGGFSANGGSAEDDVCYVFTNTGVTGGNSFLNGGAGGGYDACEGNVAAHGGFGGGGGAVAGGGGGGGYSGGGGGSYYGGGGGGSYLNSALLFNTTTDVLAGGAHSGNGEVILDQVSVAPTPEPSSIALLGTSLLGFAGVIRRRFR